MNQVAIKNRVESLDIIKGVVMVLMAIDHSRTFLHTEYAQFNAEDLTQTYPALFFTRWITHFCAPAFIFLAGTSIYFMISKGRDKIEVSNFLLKRALWLVFLELTLFRFSWNPDMTDPTIWLLVIWAIGISMVFIALIIRINMSFKAILTMGLLILFGNNLLEGIDNSSLLWVVFYKGGNYALSNGMSIYALFPLLPYFGLIALGYCFGKLYESGFPAENRKSLLIKIGLGGTALFVVLRLFKLYGDPNPWVQQDSLTYSILAFLKTTKYPVSLHYNLMTLGPAIFAAAFLESARGPIARFFSTIGKVPMFYYTLHLPAFLLLATVLGWNSLNLLWVWIWFAIVVGVLYVLCKQYAKFKLANGYKKWWISYF